MANIDALKILGSILNSGALSRGSGSNILGSVIGAMTGGGQSGGGQSQGGAGLGSLIGGMLGGVGSSQSRRGGGGGALDSIFGSGQPTAREGSGGGLSDILGGLISGGKSGDAGLGALIGAAMSQFGGQTGGAPQANFNSRDHLPQGVQYEQATEQAEIMIRAMINAAKADGQVDQEEQQKILGKLGDVTQDEVDFVRRELAEPLDVDRFIRTIPRGMEQQIYAVSLMAIDLDSNAEAQYLHKLAQGIGISSEVSNTIHEQFGAPALYK